MNMMNGSCWLTPDEQDEVCTRLLGYGLLKWDNKRNLMLKSGGKTDVYINLRDCRNKPGATSYLAECFENPLRRLKTRRLVEMPSALSGVAGMLCERLGISYVTVRDVQKAGRVSDAELIGQLVPGERTDMLDDVVTTADTKIHPYRLCVGRGVKPGKLVVLVDRQQGWRQTFDKEGIDLPVWAGMTLHDVRKFLVTNGLMQRCDSAVEAKTPIIVALDGKPWEEHLPVIDRLRPSGCILKANDLLLQGNINQVISDLSVYGRVMADPKWDDIPNTVANYCSVLRRTPPWGVTVHANGGSEMIKAAVKALEGTPTIVIVITVLTSLKGECEEIYGRLPLPQVEKLADMAHKAGARGIVCSGEEASAIRAKFPDMKIIVPGLRSPGKDAQDQQRVTTFAAAQAAGANFFVGGRQFLGAEDPVAEIQRVMKDELQITF